MIEQLVIGRLDEIRGDDRQHVCTSCFHVLCKSDGFLGGACTSTGIDRYSVIDDFDDRLDEFYLLFMLAYMEFPIGAKREDSVYAMLNQMIDELFHRFIVDGLLCIAVEWCDDRGYYAFKHCHGVTFLLSVHPGCSCRVILPDATSHTDPG